MDITNGNHRPKVSVIVPVYGVEKYIGKCAESLFGQTMQDGIEFIFVDDATKDNSIKILEETLKKYPNRINQVKIIHHPTNKGLPQARKTGFQNSSGEYILHFDSDDWMDSSMCEVMLDKALNSNSDFVVCDYFEVHQSGNILKRQLKDSNRFVENMISYKVSCAVWNKLVHRGLYNNPPQIYFPIAGMGEDMVLNFQLAMKATKIHFVDIPLTYYRCNMSGMSSIQGKEFIIKRYNQNKENTNLLIKLTHKFNYEIKNSIFDVRKFIVKSELTYLTGDKFFYKQYINTYKEINNRILFNFKIPVRLKIRHITVILKLYKYLHNLHIK